MKTFLTCILTFSICYFGMKCLLFYNFYLPDADLFFLVVTLLGSFVITFPAVSFWYNEFKNILNNYKK